MGTGEQDVEGTTRRVSKWTKMYDRHAHRALANEGLAPQLYNIWRHPVSLEWVQVSMETLGPEWVNLEECASTVSEAEWKRACEAVELALERAQRIEMPDGRLLKIDGPSAKFIMIKMTEDAAEVLFTGYEMMEWEAHTPEASIGKYHHPLQYENAPLRQKDSTFSLERKLWQIANRTKPLPPYPTQPDGKLLLHASMTPLSPSKLRQSPSKGRGMLRLSGRSASCFLAL